MECFVDSSRSAGGVEGERMQLTLAKREAIPASQVTKWPTVTWQDKDAICQVSGWHRDHARRMIRQRVVGPEPGPRTSREPVVTYGSNAVTPVLERSLDVAGRTHRQHRRRSADRLAIRDAPDASGTPDETSHGRDVSRPLRVDG